jgi:hypothetical protein
MDCYISFKYGKSAADLAGERMVDGILGNLGGWGRVDFPVEQRQNQSK